MSKIVDNKQYRLRTFFIFHKLTNSHQYQLKLSLLP